MFDLQSTAVHASLGILLLLTMNLIGGSGLLTAKYTGFSDFFNYDSSVGFNALLRILAPAIFTVLISILLYQLGQDSLTSNIWHLAIYYAVIQSLLVFLILGRGKLVKKAKFFLYHILAIALAYWVYSEAIVRGLPYLLPDEANFRTEMWFIIILFMYGLFNHMEENRSKFSDRRKRYVLSKMKVFKTKYEHLVQASPKLVRDVTYSLMIYEDYVRPRAYRLTERALAIFEKAKTTGIMQVHSSKVLSDEDSIRLTVGKLGSIYALFGEEDEHSRVSKLIDVHNSDDSYSRNVYEIYKLVKEEMKRDDLL